MDLHGRSARVDRHRADFSIGSQGGADLRAVQARGLEGIGRVHAPLQHQVGRLPDEPEELDRARRRPAASLRHEDPRRGLTLVADQGTNEPQRSTMSPKSEETIRNLIRLLVRGDYDRIEKLTKSQRLKASE